MSNVRTEAIVFPKEGEVEIREIVLPEPGPEDVLVEIEYSAISPGTERWVLLGKLREPGQPPMTPFPHVPGYQAAGVVRETGRKVRGIKPGDRVFSTGTRIDNWPGSCWGGHSHYHVADCASVIKLPAEIDTFEASGLVLAQVGYNGASKPAIKKGDVAVVIGDGLVGQWASQAFRARGAYVIMSGHHPDRLAMAEKYSADEAVNSRETDFPGFIRQSYPDGVPVAAETASKNELVRMAIRLLRSGGQLVLLGYYPADECMIDIHWIRLRETTVHCPNAWRDDRLRNTLDLIVRGKMHIMELVTHTFSYREATDAYRMIAEKTEPFLGVMLDWNAGGKTRRRHNESET